jgi:hypothetical protein
VRGKRVRGRFIKINKGERIILKEEHESANLPEFVDHVTSHTARLQFLGVNSHKSGTSLPINTSYDSHLGFSIYVNEKGDDSGFGSEAVYLLFMYGFDISCELSHPLIRELEKIMLFAKERSLKEFLFKESGNLHTALRLIEYEDRT